MTIKLYNYADLIQRFLDHSIGIQEFERDYLHYFKKEKAPMSDKLFYILDWFFAELDAYTDDPTAFLEKDHNYINEEQLREAAAKTLAELQAIKE